MEQIKLPKKYNSFTSDYIDSNWYQMLIDEEVDEKTALRSFAEEWQFQVDGFSNSKIVDNLIERFNKS